MTFCLWLIIGSCEEGALKYLSGGTTGGEVNRLGEAAEPTVASAT
jgi:hypothetical protein